MNEELKQCSCGSIPKLGYGFSQKASLGSPKKYPKNAALVKCCNCNNTTPAMTYYPDIAGEEEITLEAICKVWNKAYCVDAPQAWAGIDD